jgi:hypothetical protein
MLNDMCAVEIPAVFPLEFLQARTAKRRAAIQPKVAAIDSARRQRQGQRRFLKIPNVSVIPGRLVVRPPRYATPWSTQQSPMASVSTWTVPLSMMPCPSSEDALLFFFHLVGGNTPPQFVEQHLPRTSGSLFGHCVRRPSTASSSDQSKLSKALTLPTFLS